MPQKAVSKLRGIRTDAEQPELGPTVGVLEGETGAAHEPKAELGNPGLPVVEVLVVDAAHGAIAEQLHVPPGGGLVDLPLLGNEIRQRRERLRRRQPELDVRDARVFGQLVGDAPASGRRAIPAPVLVLERDAPGAQLLDSAQERQRDLRELVEGPVIGHEARVRVGDAEIAEHPLSATPGAKSGRDPPTSVLFQAVLPDIPVLMLRSVNNEPGRLAGPHSAWYGFAHR